MDLQELGAVALAISTDDLSDSMVTEDSVAPPFPILYDPPGGVARDYGVFNLRGDSLATASTFVIDRDGVIRWKYVGRSIADIPSTAKVLAELRLLDD